MQPADASALDRDGPFGPGARLGRLVIVRALGSGGMGVVYEADDPELGRKVAVKVLRGTGGELGGLRLVREAQTLAQLSHPNVVAVHDVGIEGDQIYVAMELVDGETLDAHLARTRPPWRRVVELFVQAGRGLAAAHARQIVHRDFKPGNVLVDREGRVRVTDFGLARQLGPAAPTATAAPAAPTRSPRDADAELATTVSGDSSAGAAPAPGLTPRALIDVALTHAGAIVGTPRYMAPEQRDGGAVTARSDQYAFCVAAWEALDGAVPAQPRVRARMPRWLARALGRGLTLEPSARHPSMTALLAIIERTPVRRRRIAIAIAAVAIAGIAAAGVVRARGSSVDCAHAGDRVAQVVDAHARAAIGAAFAKARPYGGEVAVKLAPALDAWTGAWHDARVDACRATHERGEQSAEMLDRIGTCLDGQLGELRVLVTRLGAADGAMVDHAIDAARALPAAASCSAAQVGDRPPPDWREAEARRLLLQARIEQRLGQYRDVARDAQTSAAIADDHAPGLRAEALAIAATTIADTDDARALAMLEDALAAAAKSGDRDAALSVAAQYLLRVADDESMPKIEALLPVLRADIAAAGRDSPYQLDAAESESRALFELGRYDDADRVCARIAQLEPAPAVRAADCRCRNAIGRTSNDLGPCHARTELVTRVYGPDHLETATALGDEANALEGIGRFDDALAARARARTIVDAAGERGEQAAEVHYGLGRSYADVHRWKEARAEWDETLAIYQRVQPTPDARTADIHMAIGSAAAELGDADGARSHAETAIAILEHTFGADHPSMVESLVDYGWLRHRLHDEQVALDAFRRAAAIASAKLPPGDRMLGLALLDEAEVELDLHHPAEAVPLATRAAAILGAAGADPADVARAHLALAQALRATGDRAQARREAATARDAFAALGEAGAEGLATASALLRNQ